MRTRKGQIMHSTDQKIFGWLIALTIVAVLAAVWGWLEAGDLDCRIKCLTKNHDKQQREIDVLKGKVHSLEGLPRVAACSCDASAVAELREKLEMGEVLLREGSQQIRDKFIELQRRPECCCQPAPEPPVKSVAPKRPKRCP